MAYGIWVYELYAVYVGDLERLRRFYFTGPCSQFQRDPSSGSSHAGRSSNQLALEQFLSAFYLLFCGVLLACALLGVEHLYARYIKRNMGHKEPGCLTLISQVNKENLVLISVNTLLKSY